MNVNPLLGFMVELALFAAMLFAIAVSGEDEAARKFALIVVCGGTALAALLISVIQ